MPVSVKLIFALAVAALVSLGSSAHAAADPRDNVAGSWRSVDGLPYGQVEILQFGRSDSSGRGQFSRELQDRNGNSFRQGSFSGTYTFKRNFLSGRLQLWLDYAQDPWGRKTQGMYLDADEANLVIEDLYTGAKVRYRRLQ